MNDELTKEALIESVRVFREPDGTIEEQESTVEVRVNYSEVDEIRFEPDHMDNEDEIQELREKYEPGEMIDAEYYNGAYARLRYSVDDGVARLSSFKDAEPSNGNWISVEFLRVVWAAEKVVLNVPGVEEVENARHTLVEHLNDGAGAEIDPA